MNALKAHVAMPMYTHPYVLKIIKSMEKVPVLTSMVLKTEQLFLYIVWDLTVEVILTM